MTDANETEHVNGVCYTLDVWTAYDGFAWCVYVDGCLRASGSRASSAGEAMRRAKLNARILRGEL